MVRETRSSAACLRRRSLALVAVLVFACALGRLVSGKGSPVHPAPAAIPGAGVALAAGAGGGGRGTVQSNYRSQCASCHGSTGKGDGWTAWFFRLKMRDLTDPAYVRTLTDDYLFQIIKQGGASLGKPGMPSWGQELTDQEIRDLVVYIRGLARSPQQPPSTGTGR